MRAYLDCAASTPMLPEAVEAMLPYLSGSFANPSGSHTDSRRARLAVDDAREQIAGLVGVDLGEVVFTGSGTEADNLAIGGRIKAGSSRSEEVGAMVCSGMEHHAVLSTARVVCALAGADLREVSSDHEGLVDLGELEEACTPGVQMVSVMAVNNEIGTVQPLDEVAAVVRRRSPRAVLHTDAVQAAPWLDLAAITAIADLTALSAHKFGGPKGVGALVVRNGVGVDAVIHGGGQERERRSGTHNVAGIVAMATALTLTVERREATNRRVRALRDRLVDGLVAVVPGAVETGSRQAKVPGIGHVRFSGLEAEALVILFDRAGISVSAGAACASGALEPSHVLASMGLDLEAARSGIRFSFGPSSTIEDVALTLAVVPDLVAVLRN